MKREIKFEYGFQSVNGIVKKQYYLHEIPYIQQKCDIFNDLPIIYVRQYLGIKDKNGKEIYEGDIIKESWVGCCIADNGCSGANHSEFCYEHTVQSKIFIAACDLDYENILIYPQNNTNCEELKEDDELYNYTAGIEIIGNIHENKELLK